MKRYLHILSYGLLALAILAGCGRSKPTPVQFTADELTAIGGTAQALAQQKTALASSPTAPPVTSTPYISPISGTSLVMREDGTALFLDHKAGIQLVMPTGWLSVRLNEDEYYKAFTHEAVVSNQTIIDWLTQIQDNDINVFRLEAVDIRPEYTGDGRMSIISVVFQESDTRSLEELLKVERAQKKPFTGYKFLSSKYQETANGYQVLVIEESWKGHVGTIYLRSVAFSFPTGTVFVDFSSNLEEKEAVLLDFEQVINSLGSLTP